MDNQPTQQPSTAAQTLPKKNWIPWVVIFLFLGASVITGIAYLFLSPTKPKSQVQPTSNQPVSPTPRETAKWQTYTNKNYQFSFFYPVTWKVTNVAKDEKSFELDSVGASDKAIIKVTILSDEERSKLSQAQRNNLRTIYCDQTGDDRLCRTYELTKNSQAIVFRDNPTLSLIQSAEALIALPIGANLILQITDPNKDSYNTFAILIDTLKFPNEKRAYGMQVCPDYWPTTQKEVDYNGVKIAVADLDTTWIKANCKY